METAAPEKTSTLAKIGLPTEFGALLLTLALILTISPYLGGADFGILKIPTFSQQTTDLLRRLGPVLLVTFALAFVPFWKSRTGPSSAAPRAVDNNSKYRLQSIVEIVKGEAATHGIQIDGLNIGDRFHINDLERVCSRAWFPEKSATEVSHVLQAARAKAFSSKYAEPREDEKLVLPSKIAVNGLKPWETYFLDFLSDLGVDELNQLAILDVGIGNGHAEEPFLKQIHSFKAVDVSDEALDYARKKYPQMECFVAPAENLKQIPNGSVDLYVSLRTYQSRLFDRRASLHEAYRVLRKGGIIVLSLPIMFLRADGTVLTGLIPPGSTVPDMGYARQLAVRIQEYLAILNFQNVKIDERSPFEIFLSARR
jgi:SAM-dependent methyltransferase